MPTVGDKAQTPASPTELEALVRYGIGGRRPTRKNQTKDKRRRNR